VTTLSTHVLDTERGKPAVGLRVALYRGEQSLAQIETGPDGRVANLAGGSLDAGTYRLVFDVAGYFAAQGRQAPFLERVSVEFRIDTAVPHYHVPLLLTPYACTSYRGS
jgi:5-hydroxyisourate hydrolase